MDISNILKILWFIVLLWFFFSSDFANNVFIWIREKIWLFNTNFFEKIPTDILFLFVFFIFIIILSFIMSFFSKD
jgi:hypothetical protein